MTFGTVKVPIRSLFLYNYIKFGIIIKEKGGEGERERLIGGNIDLLFKNIFIRYFII